MGEEPWQATRGATQGCKHSDTTEYTQRLKILQAWTIITHCTAFISTNALSTLLAPFLAFRQNTVTEDLALAVANLVIAASNPLLLHLGIP